ncbi:hypothetical protein E2542_SST18971 [Spatholobus suberectus]|nr:hypothetical protein E2542_SST18971 [Spatholobus suberectus]
MEEEMKHFIRRIYAATGYRQNRAVHRVHDAAIYTQTLRVRPAPTTKIAPPPPQIPKTVPSPKPVSDSDDSVLGFVRNAVTKVQTAHSSLDDHLARWFGLNQSKYQWALDDYYESKGMEKGDIKVKEISSKVQSV